MSGFDFEKSFIEVNFGMRRFFGLVNLYFAKIKILLNCTDKKSPLPIARFSYLRRFCFADAPERTKNGPSPSRGTVLSFFNVHYSPLILFVKRLRGRPRREDAASFGPTV